MTYNILGSGSSGNGTIVFDHILIDCGVPFTKIAAYVKEIQLVLLTHEHGDHFKPSTVKTLHEIRPTVRFACCEWMAQRLVDAGVSKNHIDVLDPGRWYEYGPSFCVSPVVVPHNVPNCGWSVFRRKDTSDFSRINHYGWEKIFYVTDASSLTGINAEHYDLYMIECNHKEDEIREKIKAKQARGEYAYEVEAQRNHLSWEQAMSWLAENGPEGKFIPMHQHVDKE